MKKNQKQTDKLFIMDDKARISDFRFFTEMGKVSVVLTVLGWVC